VIKNYFKAALRNIRHSRVFSAIHVLGLAIGISASLIIFLIVKYDFSFDHFETSRDRIYRVVTNSYFAGNRYPNSGVTAPMGDAVQKEVAGLDVVAPFYTWYGAKITVAGLQRKPAVFKNEQDIVFAGPGYFKLVTYSWLAGSPETSLSEPYQVVLTESVAKKYFPLLPASEVIGRVIQFNDSVGLNVTGVVKKLQANTDFRFTTFISRATLEKTTLRPGDWQEWGNTNSASQLFIRLSPGTDTAQIRARIGQLYEKYHTKQAGDRSVTQYSLQPLGDIHFNPDYDNFDQRQAHRPTLYGLMAIALFLLLLGCINFINLSTAQASHRAREIGIRKTLGSSKKQLILQFLSETFFLTTVATILSVILTPLLLKAFSDFIPAGLHFTWYETGNLLFLVGVTGVVSLLSGFYPALVLSSYRPVLVLNNQLQGSGGHTRNAFLRKILSVSQFVIAQVFIIATLVVGKQIRYSLNKDMGFRKDAVVYFHTPFTDSSESRDKVLLQKLRAIREIASISLSDAPPSSSGYSSSTVKYIDGKKEIENDVLIKWADTGFIRLYKITLLAGTNLPYSDTVHDLLINETFSKALGFTRPEQAIGKEVQFNNRQDVITGVVGDFNTASIHRPIKPVLIGTRSVSLHTFNILLQPGNAEGTTWKNGISKIEKAWKEIYPEDGITVTFLDDSIAKYYAAEQHISRLLTWAAALAILISCLGLLGLVMYTTNQRTKEIGIRKVIGARASQIVLLLSKDFIRLIAIAFIIAVPIVWYAAGIWLENFAYKTTVSIWVFLAGGSIMLAMAMAVLLLRTYKAAAANPVRSLRNE
jgi:predicted permease